MRYKIILAGSHGGTLDEIEVESEDGVPKAVAELALRCTLAGGDTISILDTQEDTAEEAELVKA